MVGRECALGNCVSKPEFFLAILCVCVAIALFSFVRVSKASVSECEIPYAIFV